MNVVDVFQQNAIVHAAIIRGRNGFDGVELGGRVQVGKIQPFFVGNRKLYKKFKRYKRK